VTDGPAPAASADRTLPVYPASVAEGVTPEAVQARFDRLTAILTEMVGTADGQARHRCPYKDRNDRCTARFGCRNQRRIPDEPEARRCAGDDRLDYRSAWETT